MFNQNPDVHTLNRERMRQRYQLSDAILTVAVDETVFSLHRRFGDSGLWSVQTSMRGGVTVAGGGPRTITTTDIEGRRVIYGMLPPAASAVRITTDAGHQIEALIAEGLFCVLTLPVPCALATFYDADGRVQYVYPLLDPALILAQRPRWSRWRAWLRQRLVQMVSVRYACIYHRQSRRRRQ